VLSVLLIFCGLFLWPLWQPLATLHLHSCAWSHSL
jgi:hypothetical protein